MKPLVCLAAALAISNSFAHAAPVARPILGVDRAYIDTTVPPGKDFYDYANGAFAEVAIPGEYSNWGVNQEIDERSFAILKGILESSVKSDGPKSSVAQRVGDFYGASMDESAIEREGLKSLAPFMAEIHFAASTSVLQSGVRRVVSLYL